MDQVSLSILTVTAASIGFFHTLFGPDHYVPFIVMSKAGKWSFRKTAWLTLLCGLGHVLSSVVLGLIGIACGVAVSRLEWIESGRGELAAWALIAFGLFYFIWGVRQGVRNKPHTHVHLHEDGNIHSHKHVHQKAHAHAHASAKRQLTPWILFTIFVLGPCEPLIPILMYPAAANSLWGVCLVTLVFCAVTVFTMLGMVTLASFGIQWVPVKFFERYVHAMAGLTILACGASIQFLGL